MRSGGGGGDGGWSGGDAPRPVSVLLEEEARADALAHRLMAKAHDALVEENVCLVGKKEVLEDWLHGAMSLARAQHREVMESASQVEEEARLHGIPPSRSGNGLIRSFKLQLGR